MFQQDGLVAMREPLAPATDGTFPRYDIEVQLTGVDGNAWMVMGVVRKALRRAGVSTVEIEKYSEESMSGDYDNLLAVAFRWVSVS